MEAKRIAAAAAVLVAAGVGAIDVSARPTPSQPLRLSGAVFERDALSEAVGDGVRFVGWQAGTPSAPQSHYVDDVTGATVPLPEGCNRGGRPQDGRALVICGETYAILSLTTGRLVPITGVQANDRFEDVGDQWAFGSPNVDGKAVLRWTNWHTGETHDQPASGQLPNYDLDAPGFGVRKPIIAAGVLTGRPDSRVATEVRLPRLQIRLPSGIRTIRQTCAGSRGCAQIQYTSGVVSWREGAAACAHVVSTTRTGCWRLSADVRSRERVTGVLVVSHTRRNLYVALRHSRPYGRQWPGSVLIRVPLTRLR